VSRWSFGLEAGQQINTTKRSSEMKTLVKWVALAASMPSAMLFLSAAQASAQAARPP